MTDGQAFNMNWRANWGGVRPFGGAPGSFNGNPYSFYSLLDIFSGDQAAGAVNGTSAVVGGARTVTDGNSKLSITGGVLSFATGGVGNQNPMITYPTQARVLGKVLIGDILFTTVRNVFGWISGTTDYHDIEIDTTSNLYNNAASVAFKPILVAATLYNVAIVLRTNGAYWFIKGGVNTNWTIIWQSATGNATPLTPTVAVVNTTTVLTADNIRVPVSTYIPTPLAYDTFTRADGAIGTSETTGPDAQAVTGLAWTGATYTISTNKAINTPTLGSDIVVNGAFAADTDWNKGAGWTIAAGTAVATAASSDITAAAAPLTVGTWYQTAFTQGGFGGGTVNVKLGTTAFPTHGANGTFTETGLALSTALALTGVGLTDTVDNFSAKALTLNTLFASVSQAVTDVMADVNVTLVSATDGKQAGLVLNLDSAGTPANFRLVYLDGYGNCVISQCVAGVYTIKQTTAITYSAGATLRAVTSGTTVTAFYNNALVGAAQTCTANTNALVGLFDTSPLSSVDVFQAFAVGTNDATYSGLNAL